MKTRILLSVGCVAFSVLLTSCDNPEKDFKKAQRANTETAYAEFIKRHPESPLVTQAQTNLENIGYQTAKSNGTPQAFEQFLGRFPKSLLVKEAQVELERIAFTGAMQTNTEQSFQVFIKQHPDGPYAAKARFVLDMVVVQKMDTSYSTNRGRAVDKIAADKKVVDDLAAKSIPEWSGQYTTYIDGGGQCRLHQTTS